MKRRVSLIIALSSATITTLGSVASVHADEIVQTRERSRAQTVFAEGRVLLEQERYVEAEQKFREALAVKDTPGLRYHVAFCLERRELLLEARVEYARAAELLELERAEDVAALLPVAVDRVDAATPRLVPREFPAQARLWVDGVEIVPLAEVPVNPGEHAIRIEAPGFETHEDRIVVSIAEKRAVLGHLVKTRSSAAPTEAPAGRASTETATASESSLRPIVFWTSGGVALVGLGVGVTGLVLREVASGDAARHEADIERRDASSSACLDPSGNLAESCAALGSSVALESDATNVAIAGFATFGVGLAAAAVTHFFWPGEEVQVGMVPAWSERALVGGHLEISASF